MKIWWLEKCPLSYISWRLVVRRMRVVLIWRRECMIDGARCFSFEITNLCVIFCVRYILMFFHWCFKCVDVGNAQFVKAGFISWKFGQNLCDMEGQGLDLCVFDTQFIEAIFIVWEFGWYICEFFFMLVCVGTFICKFCKNSGDIIIQGFISEWMLQRSDFDRESEVREVAGTIDTDYLCVLEL